MTALHRNGSTIPVEMGMWAHDDGEGFSAFVHDITERVTTQADLKMARDDAMQASRLKSEFLANMSHEIRTPMNGVLGMAGLLLHTELDAVQRDYAETVCSSGEALLTVINDILDFSKIEAGKLDVESVPFDLRSVVELSAALIAARAQQGGLELTCRIDPAMPPLLLGDPGRLRQVLLNLLGNAVKFTPEGEINLTALLIGGEVAGVVTVDLSVRDTGIGMTAATTEQLFDAFTQADTSTTRRYGGTGLGLAISRQLVELMGGTLNVTSQMDAGSTFRAVVPFSVGAAAAPEVDAADMVGVHVLVVDDNTTNRRVLVDLVRGWGSTAAQADGAEQALMLLRQSVDDAHPFEVILLDLNMPDIDGYGLAEMVRADPRLPPTPMIMLTSSARTGEAEKTRQVGIGAHLTKPVRSGLLRQAMTDVLAEAAATDGGVPRPSAAAWPQPAAVVADGSQPRPAALVDSSRAAVVLIVEDDLVNQKVLTALLRRIGFGVDIAVNGFDALEALEHNRYAAVLMDCQMPVMDGYQTTEKLRQREGTARHTHVIAVTASAMASDRTRCLEAGMDDFLTKPISTKDLAASLTGLADSISQVVPVQTMPIVCPG
jgi:signal transduction histidine kinase/CheY-like chemotaxis protein